MVEICHKYGAAVMLDGAHTLGAMELDLNNLNCEYYIMSAHKWFGSVKGCAL